MAITYKQIIENGGGTIAYLWHVGGYPWAVTDTPALITALSNTADSTVQKARKRLFGSNTWTQTGSITPAYTVPIFPGLMRDFGNVKWQMEETKGMMSGGDWHVKIEDRVHGHVWQHKASGDEIWGLEGLHRIAQVKSSSVHGWAYLEDNFLRLDGAYSPQYIDIDEQSGNKLRARVDALSGDEYVVVWLNHEAVAVNAVNGTFPEYGLEVANYSGPAGENGRGLYRSRWQDHFTSVLAGLDPIVADVPGSIAGKYCWLYAIPLIDGEVQLTDGGDPLIVEELRGVVSPNISTESSVTRVSIRNDRAATERRAVLELSTASQSHLAGFVFTRGDVPSDDLGEIRKRWQMPHLVINEFIYPFDGVVAEQIGEPGWLNPGDEMYIWPTQELVDPPPWKERYIWLCKENETVFFPTVQDVIDALNDELTACYDNTERNSEETNLSHLYSVANYSDGDSYIFYTTEYTEGRPYLEPYITGPLAWVFNLGHPVNENNNIYTIFNECARENAPSPMYGYRILETCADNRVVPLHSLSAGRTGDYWMHSKSKAIQEGIANITNSSVPLFYYTYPWVDLASSIDDSIYSPNDEFDIPSHGGGYDPPESGDDEVSRFYLPSDTDDDAYADGESITLGRTIENNRGPLLHGNVDELTDLDFTSLKSLTIDTSLSVWAGDDQLTIGFSLFFLPMLDEDGDPHMVKKSFDVQSTDLSDIFRVILGETISGISLAKEIQHTSCPFFTTTEDFVSAIDWDSLDALNSLSQTYTVPVEKLTDNIFDLLKNEILFHAATMIREFDYSDLMWKYRFRHIGPINATTARNSGLTLLEGKMLRGAPVEHHGSGDIYNALNISGLNYIIEQKGSHAVGTTDRRILKIRPYLSRSMFPFFAPAFFKPMLDVISTPCIEQQKGSTIMQSLFPVGKEVLVTDSTARVPFTHALGLDNQPALITGTEFDVKKGKGSITYRISSGVSDAPAYGYAPACKLTSGNFSKNGSELSGTPEDHEFTSSTEQPKDVYFFDCFDLSDKDTPVPRTSCGCADYKVWAIELGTYNWTPLSFTCSVNATTGVITLSGDTTNIDEAEDYVIIFRSYDDLETCQKWWVMHADDNNTVGTAEALPNRWV